MHTLKLLVCLMFLAPLLWSAQVFDPPPNLAGRFLAAGVNLDTSISPPVSGWGLYAQKLIGGTYSFNYADLTSRTLKPFTVQVTVLPGLAQYLGKIGPVSAWGAGNLGFARAGENAGLAYSLGGAGVIGVKNHWHIVVPVRATKTALGDWQITVGIGPGFSSD